MKVKVAPSLLTSEVTSLAFDVTTRLMVTLVAFGGFVRSEVASVVQ